MCSAIARRRSSPVAAEGQGASSRRAAAARIEREALDQRRVVLAADGERAREADAAHRRVRARRCGAPDPIAQRRGAQRLGGARRRKRGDDVDAASVVAQQGRERCVVGCAGASHRADESLQRDRRGARRLDHARQAFGNGEERVDRCEHRAAVDAAGAAQRVDGVERERPRRNQVVAQMRGERDRRCGAHLRHPVVGASEQDADRRGSRRTGELGERGLADVAAGVDRAIEHVASAGHLLDARPGSRCARGRSGAGRARDDAVEPAKERADQTRSTTTAMPWPTPMHIVHSA